VVGAAPSGSATASARSSPRGRATPAPAAALLPTEHAHKAADAEAAPRVSDATGPSTTAPGANSPSLAPAANSCLACGNSEGKLQRCGRCRKVWFCNRECQVVARKELDHRNGNCRPTDGAQVPQIDRITLDVRYNDIMNEAGQARMAPKRLSDIAAVEKYKEASTVADLIGGEEGAFYRAEADGSLSACLIHAGDMVGAAHAACSAARAARTSGRRPALVLSMFQCGNAAMEAPVEMATAEQASRKQERLCDSWSYGPFDLSQEGRVRMPTTPDGVWGLALAYHEAAVDICDAALAAAGGRGNPASDDDRDVPDLGREGAARCYLGAYLSNTEGGRQRGLELMRQGVALLRQHVRAAADRSILEAKLLLAHQLCNLGCMLHAPGCDEAAEAEVCLREALDMSKEIGAVNLKQNLLGKLANLSSRTAQPVGPPEAAALRARMNTLHAQTGRNPDTSCIICLEPLEQPGGGAGTGADGADGRAVHTDSLVRVLHCGHQFHLSCLTTWWRTRSDERCPLCKK